MTHDQSIVRELAKTYMSLVCTEQQERMTRRFRDTNDLKLVRPPVILDEISRRHLVEVRA